jgi:DNA repair protein RadA
MPRRAREEALGEEELVERGLRDLNVSPTVVQKLKSRGMLTMRDMRYVVAMTPDELIEELGLTSYEQAYKLQEAAKRIIGYRNTLMTARQLAQQKTAVSSLLTTGVRALDELMGGGLSGGEIYEFAGEFGTGKTQLSHQLSVTVQLPRDKGGLGAKAVYIDTETTFSPERVEAMAKRFGAEDALDNIYVYRPLNTGELERFVRNELNTLLDQGARLVVVDSIIALYRAQFKGLEWLARRQQAINYLLDWLKRWGRIYGAVVVITNQVLTHPLPSGIALKIPAGGNIIAHASTHRFLLKKAGETWVMECLDSPRIARGATAEYVIRDDGVWDA